MLNRFVVNALTDTLTRVESKAEQSGWDAPPVLLGIFRHPATNILLIETEHCPIDPRVWHQPGLTPPAALEAISRYFATEDMRPPLAEWLRPNERRFLGVVFVVEAWTTTPYEGYRRGDLNQVPAMADAEIRTLTAVDTDRRLYQLVRIRGNNKPSITVLDQAPPQLADTTIGEALLRLVRLAHDARGDSSNRGRP